MSGRHYTAEEKAAVLAVLAANGGNVAKAATRAGVPRKTLTNWVREQEAAEGRKASGLADGHKKNDPSPALIAAAKVALSDKFEAIAHKMVDGMDDPAKIEASSLATLATAAGIAVDKMRLLRGQATNISGQEDLPPDERARRIRAIFDRARARGLGIADGTGAGGSPGADGAAVG